MKTKLRRDRASKTEQPATPVKLRPFSDSLPMLLLRGRESVMRHFRSILREHGITEQQWRILRALTTAPALEVKDLARATYLLGPSLSRILKDLEGRGLIERSSNERDLRKSHIAISEDGLALIHAATPRSEAIYRAIAAAYGPERLRSLQQSLADLEAIMSSIDPRAYAASRRKGG
jgi:homoprotocatechuate degradation regulator HpaR